MKFFHRWRQVVALFVLLMWPSAAIGQVAHGRRQPQQGSRLEQKALIEYLSALANLAPLLQSLIKARANLRELVRQEQATWTAIVGQPGAPRLENSLTAEEANLREATLPGLTAITTSYERSLAERLQALDVARREPAGLQPRNEAAVEVSLQVDVVFAQLAPYATLEQRTVNRLSELHAGLLEGRPHLLTVSSPGSRRSLRELILQVADAQRVVRRHQTEIEISKRLLEQRLTVTGLEIAREELRGVRVQEALAERIQRRIRNLTTRGPETKGAVEALKTLHEIVVNSLTRTRVAVAAKADPLWLDQDTILYLPPVSGDPEFSSLRASREQVGWQLQRILDQRIVAQDELKAAVEERNAVFRKALPFLTPKDGKEVGSAWKQAEEWLEIEGQQLKAINMLRSALNEPQPRSSSERLASQRQAAALTLLGRTIESLIVTEELLTSLMSDLLDVWAVPADFKERAVQVQRKLETLTHFTAATENVLKAVRLIRRDEGKERQAFADLQLYVAELNRLRLKRLTEASLKVAALRLDPEQAAGPSKVASMVRRWLTREQADSEEAIKLAAQVRAERARNPLLALEWLSQERMWADALEAGPGMRLIEAEVGILGRLPDELARVLNKEIPPDRRFRTLLQFSDQLGLLQGVREAPDGVTVILADGVEEVRIEGMGADWLRLTRREHIGSFNLIPAVLSSKDVRSILLVGSPDSSAPPVAPSGSDEMGFGERFVKIGAASFENSKQAVKNNWKSYAVLGGMATLGGLMVATGFGAPVGTALLSAAGKGLLITAYVDTSVATAKTAVQAIDPAQAEKYQRQIDAVKGAYDIGKFAETIYKSVNIARVSQPLETQMAQAQAEARSLENVRGVASRLEGRGIWLPSDVRPANIDWQVGQLKREVATLATVIEKLGGGGAYVTSQIAKELGHLLSGSGKSTGEKIVKGVKAVDTAVTDDQRVKEQEAARKRQEAEEARRKAEEEAKRKALQDALKRAKELIAAAQAAAKHAQSALAAAKGAAAAAGNAATGVASVAQGAVQQAKGAVQAARATCARVVSEGVIDAARARAVAEAGNVSSLYEQVVNLATGTCKTAAQAQKASQSWAKANVMKLSAGLAAQAKTKVGLAQAALGRAKAEAAQAAQHNANRQAATQAAVAARAALAAARGQVSTAEGALSAHEATASGAQEKLEIARAASQKVESYKAAARGVLGPFMSEGEAQEMLSSINGLVTASMDGVGQPAQQALSAIQKARTTVSQALDQLGVLEGALGACENLAPTDSLAQAATAAAGSANHLLSKIAAAAGRAAECAGGAVVGSEAATSGSGQEPPPPPVRVLSHLVVSCQPNRIKVGQIASCQAVGEYSDRVGVMVDLTGVAVWSPGSRIEGIMPGSHVVRASHEGASGTAMVTVVEDKKKGPTDDEPKRPLPDIKGAMEAGSEFQGATPWGKPPGPTSGALGGGPPIPQPNLQPPLGQEPATTGAGGPPGVGPDPGIVYPYPPAIGGAPYDPRSDWRRRVPQPGAGGGQKLPTAGSGAGGRPSSATSSTPRCGSTVECTCPGGKKGHVPCDKSKGSCHCGAN